MARMNMLRRRHACVGRRYGDITLAARHDTLMPLRHFA